MLVVKNIITGRIVYRQEPPFKPGNGIKKAVLDRLGMPGDLVEIDVAKSEWQSELSLREAEQPLALSKVVADLEQRIAALEQHVL